MPIYTMEISKEIKKLIIEMAYRSGTSHIGPSLSISDILSVLYFKILNVNPKKPNWPNRDRFILSKGHGAAALYATLALKGFFPKHYLREYRINQGIFHGHPCREAAPGIEASTGSLGHGLSIGAGMALALKDDGINSKVYVLLGDGECDEGSVWEAAKFIGANRISNIVGIVDWNKFQGFRGVPKISNLDLEKQWNAFGWDTLHVSGHDFKDLEKKFRMAKQAQAPTVIIADTISGKGIPHIENTLLAHYYTIPDQKIYKEILKTIDEK